MPRFTYPKPFENKLQSSYFKETLERSFLFRELIVSTDKASYKLARQGDSEKALTIITKTFAVAEKMTVNKVFEKEADVVFNDDIFDKLIGNGEVNEIGDGIFVFQGQFLKLMRFFDGIFTKFADELNGVEQYYPTRWPIELFKKINYFEEFPQNILLVSGAKKEREALESLIDKYGKSKDFTEIKLGDFLEPATTALGTSTCDPCYYIHKNGKLGKNETYYALSKCFRNEKSTTNQLDRLTEFSMREVIAAGEEEFVKSQRETFLKFIESFASFTGLACSLEKASDPFFTNEIPEKSALQNHIESKFELLVPLGNERSDLAVGSVNWHSDFFGRSFEIRDNSNYYMSSCCLAFGLERLVFAFLTQHGMTRSEWPAEVQKDFADFETNGSGSKTSLLEIRTPNQKVSPSANEINGKDEDLNTSEHRETLRALLVECLNLELTEEEWLSSRNTFNWDSLNHMKVITCIEERFEVVIPNENHSTLMDEKSILTFLESESSE
jgi:seryl-tRNA synthetase/acyl carrier protein